MSILRGIANHNIGGDDSDSDSSSSSSCEPVKKRVCREPGR